MFSAETFASSRGRNKRVFNIVSVNRENKAVSSGSQSWLNFISVNIFGVNELNYRIFLRLRSKYQLSGDRGHN